MIKHGIFKEVTRDLGIAVLVAAGIAVLGFCAPADAQVVQPQYVRPSKGARVVSFTGKTVAVGAAASCKKVSPCLSSVYDMTAFDAVQLYLVDTSTQAVLDGPWLVPNLPPFIKLKLTTELTGAYIGVQVLGSSAATAGFAFLFGSPNASYVSDTAIAGTNVDLVMVPVPFSDLLSVVGQLPSGKTIGLGLFPNPVGVGGIKSAGGGLYSSENVLLDGASIGGSFNALNVNVTNASAAPIPVKPVPSTTASGSAQSTIAAAASKVHNSAATHCSVVVVNTGINPAWCSQTASVTTGGADQGIPLNAATFAGLAGGSVTFDNYGGDVYCIATAPAPTTVVTQVVTCP